MKRTLAMITALLLLSATAAACVPSTSRDEPAGGTSSSLSVSGTAFYVSTSGDDADSGTSAGEAWRTLARAGEQVLHPGDALLLHGGERFDGTLVVDEQDGGDAANPVVVASFGEGRPLLESAEGAAVYVHNTSGVSIRGLDLRHRGGFSSADGLAVYNDRPAGAGPLSGVTIHDVDVSGFANGISVGGASSGFASVQILDSSAHGNRLNGVNIYGPRIDAAQPVYANSDVLVSRTSSYGNLGDPDAAVNTGSGIVIGSTRNARVEGSVAHGNGELCNAPAGPNGIWAYDSTQVTFERNVAYGNHTGAGTADGNGFDFDVNVSDSVMQYNLSYGNDGAGFFLFTYAPHSLMSGNVVRYNVSSNDVRRRAFYAGIMLASPYGDATASSGTLNDTQIYHNTVVMSPNPEGAPAALRMYGEFREVVIADNVFVAEGGSPLLISDSQVPQHTQLAGNLYWSTDGAPRFLWDGHSYVGLTDWRSATGQETSDGQPTGLEADPLLPGAFDALEVAAPDGLPGAPNLIPAADSPARSGGLDLAPLGIDRGPRTYFGTGHPCSGPGIGAGC